MLSLALGRLLFHLFDFVVTASQVGSLLLLVFLVVGLLLGHLLLAFEELVLQICSVSFGIEEFVFE